MFGYTIVEIGYALIAPAGLLGVPGLLWVVTLIKVQKGAK
jgi:hypothetical protein